MFYVHYRSVMKYNFLHSAFIFRNTEYLSYLVCSLLTLPSRSCCPTMPLRLYDFLTFFNLLWLTKHIKHYFILSFYSTPHGHECSQTQEADMFILAQS